ncbi:MAG: Ig-like domain-containing protein [Chloroflexota bacterium]
MRLDAASQKIYYFERPQNQPYVQLNRIDVDGSNKETLVTLPYTNTIEFPTDLGKYYYSDLAVDINYAPLANSQFFTITQGTPLTFALEATDANLGASLAYTITAASRGSVTGFPLTPSPTQPLTLTYTPQAGFSGLDQFSYRVSDGRADDEATVTIQVLPETTLATAVLTPTVGHLLTSTDPVAVTIAGHAHTPTQAAGQRGIQTMTFSVNGVEIATPTCCRN